MFGVGQSLYEPRVYRRSEGSVVVFLVLHVDNILSIKNDIGGLSTVKI